MRRLIIILFLILTIVNVAASNVGTAEVSVFVSNDPPVISDLSFSNSQAGEDIHCKANFEDELESIHLNYEWHKNGILLENKKEFLESSHFEEGDIITCAVTPHDFVQDGNTESVSVSIEPEPLFSQITGAAIGVGESKGSLGVLMILALIPISIFFFRRSSRQT